MWFGMLISSAIIAGVVGLGKLFKVKVVDRLDKFYGLWWKGVGIVTEIKKDNFVKITKKHIKTAKEIIENGTCKYRFMFKMPIRNE